MAGTLAHILAVGKKYGDPWWKRQRPILLEHAHNRHIAVYGQPGVGKSSAAYSQTLQDITANQSFFLLEPHGDLQGQVLTSLIAQGWRPEDVVIIDPPRTTFGFPGIHLFETEPGQTSYEVVDELLGAFKQIWWDSWGARMEDILRNTFLALQETGLTLAEAERFLTDSTFRSAVVQTLTNEDVKHYWAGHFASLKDAEQRFFVEAPRNKLSAFLGSPYIKPIFAQTRSTIRFADIMNTGKACLINLSQNHLKESRKLLGALLLAKLSLAILSRANLPPEQRSPVTIYCDEAPEYFVKSCLLIAAGSRKFGISYRIFAQSPSQFREEDADILFATIGTHMVFNVDRKSAERLAKELFAPDGKKIKYVQRDVWGQIGYPQYYTVQEELEHYIAELTTQGMAECYVRIKGLDEDPRPYIATILPVTFPTPDAAKEEAFRQASAAVYYVPLERIEQERQERLARYAPKPRPLVTKE